MNNKNLVITDNICSNYSYIKNLFIISWNRNKPINKKNFLSIFDIIESNSLNLRNKFLDFIRSLSNKRVNVDNKKEILFNSLKINNFNSWWYTNISEKCNWAKSYYINEVIKCIALESKIKNKKFKKIYLDISNARTISVLVDFFEKKKIKVVILNKHYSNEKFNPERIYLTKIFFSIFKFLFKTLSNFKYMSVNINEWKNFNAKYLFISYLNREDLVKIKKGFFQSSYWGNLNKKLSEIGIKSRWIYFVAGNNKLSINPIEAIKKLNLNKDQKHLSIFNFLNFKILIRSIFIWIKLIIRVKNIQYPKDLFTMKETFLDFWPHFKNDWIKSFQNEEMIYNIVVDQIFRDILKNVTTQEKCFYLSENVPWEFSLIKSWKDNDHKKIYGVPHSTISFWDLRHFFSKKIFTKNKKYDQPLPNKIIVNGLDMKHKLTSSGFNKEKIISAEALRYIDLLKIRKTKKNLKIKKKTKILMVLDIADEVAKSQIELAKKLINDHSGIEIKIKIHPAGNIRSKNYKEIFSNFSTEPLLNLLKKTDIMFSSNITAASAEAYILGIPVLTYINQNTLNLSPLKDKKEIKFLTDANNFLKVINVLKINKIKNKKNTNFFFINGKLNNWRKILINN